MSKPVDARDLSDRHIFLTGGTGAVGRTLIDHFARHPESARPTLSILTRDPGKFAAHHPAQAGHSWIRLVEGSLSDLPDLPAGVTEVIHGAADTHLATGHAGWVAQIVAGTDALLAASTKAGVARFLLISSGAVYGPQPAEVTHLHEDYNGAPDPRRIGSTYGQAKRVAEQLCSIYRQERGVETVIARLFAFGSAHIPKNGPYALGSFVRDALTPGDAPIAVAGDGTAVRSYLSGSDMAAGLMTVLCAGTAGDIYNIGSNQGISIADLARAVRDRLSPGKDVAILRTAGSSERNYYVPDVSRIAALGAPPSSDICDVIDEVATG